MGTLPGFGDSATWPPVGSMSQNDPRIDTGREAQREEWIEREAGKLLEERDGVLVALGMLGANEVAEFCRCVRMVTLSVAMKAPAVTAIMAARMDDLLRRGATLYAIAKADMPRNGRTSG